MTGREGFFTRREAKGRIPRKSDYKHEYDPRTLQKIGLKGARRMNPDAHWPNMKPTGAKRPDVYVLGEAPGKDEDEAGEQFIGRSGQYLRSFVPSNARVAWDNVVRTRPPKNRTPTWQEVEYFRTAVEKSVERAKPKAILGVGGTTLKWALPGLTGRSARIKTCQGRRFPIRVGSHRCWFYPVYHPAYILRVCDMDRPDELRSVFERSVRRVFRAKIKRAPHVESPEKVMDGVSILSEPKRILEELECWGGGSFALDIETSTLRPYARGAKLLSLALSDGVESVSFPVEHREAGFSKKVVQRILEAIRRLLFSRPEVVIQNLAFELEWFVSFFGPEVARKADWHDTMVQAYCLDERPGGHNLDYLCRLAIGLPLKSLSKVTGSRLASEPLSRLLPYNALDAKYTMQVHEHQMPLLERRGMAQRYEEEQLRRIPTVVLTQAKGADVDVKVTDELGEKYDKALRRLVDEAHTRPEVEEYEERHGTFKLTSTAHVGKVFRDILEVTDSTSTAEKILTPLREDVPLARIVLEHRRIAKLKGTYIDRFRPDHKETYVFPDGKIHTIFNTARTGTSRLASEDPNVQNQPKRGEGREVRRQIIPPKGHVLLAADYGQLEARVIGTVSQDKAFCKMLRTEYDVHMEWAERLVQTFPKILRRHKDIKVVRFYVKHEWVFPLFFGASWYSRVGFWEVCSNWTGKACRSCGGCRKMRGLFEEFWDIFYGILAWQEDQMRFYRNNHFIETITGWRRRAPLSKNQVINCPIQGPASDIVIEAMSALSERSVERDEPWYQPIFNIHDDLTFVVPKKEEDEAIDVIARTMCDVQYDWVNVPITVEIERGLNWYEMEAVGVFRSDEIL